MGDSINLSQPVYRGISETQKASGASTYFIRKHIANGDISHIRCGRRILIHYPKFLEWLETLELGGGRHAE